MGQIKDILTDILPLSREKQALKAFVFTTHTFIISTCNPKTPPEIVDYCRQIESTTGLTKRILLSSAVSDLIASDGMVDIYYKRLGRKPLASFFESQIDNGGGKRIILGIDLNLDAPIKYLPGGLFYLSEENTYSVVNALVEAEVFIKKKDREGTAGQILKRSERLCHKPTVTLASAGSN